MNPVAANTLRVVRDEEPAPYAAAPQPRMDTPRRRGKYAILPAKAATDPRLGDAAIRVLVVLGTYANRDGYCRPSQSSIAQAIGKSRTAVTHAIRELVEAGYLRKVRCFNDITKAEVASDYWLIFPDDAPEPGTPPCEVSSHPLLADRHTPPVAQLTPPCELTSHKRTQGERTQVNDPGRGRARARVPVDVSGTDGQQPDRAARLCTLLQARGVPFELRRWDREAVNSSALDVAAIADCYTALYQGEFGVERDRVSLTVERALGKVPAYLATRRPAPANGTINARDLVAQYRRGPGAL